MAKELPFFKFEISEWMFGRIQKQPLDVQGTFINLCCKYWHKLGEYTYEDVILDFDKTHIDQLIESKIIGGDSYIFIKFLDTQLDECASLSKKNSINGLKSALARAQRKSTTVQRPLTIVQRISTEEKRREDILCIGEISKTISLAYNKRYDRDHGGQIGQDIDYLSKDLLEFFTKETIQEQIQAHKLFIGLHNFKPPSKIETIKAALLENDWIKKLKDSQNKENIQNGLANEQARNGSRINNGSDLPPANTGRLND